MNNLWKVVAVAGGVGVLAYGYAYYKATDKLQFNFAGIQSAAPANDGAALRLNVGIQVVNPSRFTYPIPNMYFDIYNAAGGYIGRATNKTIQLIPPGISYVYAEVIGDIGQSAQLLLNYALGQFTSIELKLVGGIQLGNMTAPLNIDIKT